MIHSAVDSYATARTAPVAGTNPVAVGVSWGAILAGAFAAAALSFLLIILGFGLGFSSVSPWSNTGFSAQAIGYSTIVWITLTQIAASAGGGYLAGRLRVKLIEAQTEETHFRDSAHGFLSWAVAALVTAAFLSSAIGSILSGGTKLAGSASTALTTIAVAGGTNMASDTRNGASKLDSMSNYFIDSLFRMTMTDASNISSTAGSSASETRDNAITPAQRLEIAHIFANAIQNDSLPATDKAYVSQLLARHAGLSHAEAEKRVSDMYIAYHNAINNGIAKAKELADQARKVAAYSALWMFFALLCGALVACFSATYGGRQREKFSAWSNSIRTTATSVTS